MADTGEAGSGLVANLTKLEINTIIKDNLTARKMPDVGNAILDVALTYAWELHERGFDIDAWFADPLLQDVEDRPLELRRADLQELESALGEVAKRRLEAMTADHAPLRREDDSFDDSCITLSAKTFIALRWAAWVLGQHPGVHAQQRVILDRVRKNSDQMKNLVLRLYGAPNFEAVYRCNRNSLNKIDRPGRSQARDALLLEPGDMTLLRKTWEIGVQEVVAQTVIDLDGDSITYIARRYSAPSWGHMLEVHRLGVSSAVGYWSGLMEAMRRFVTDLASIALGSGGNRK